MNSIRPDIGAVVTGLLFLLVGVVFGVDAYLAWDLAPAVLWPGLLVFGGVALLARGRTVRH
jgi:hypothetical protein